MVKKVATIMAGFLLVFVLLMLWLVTAVEAQPATSPITMPVTCVRNKGECPRGSARMTYAELQAAGVSGVDAGGRPFNHRGFMVWVYDCNTSSCTSGGGSTLCGFRGSDDGLTWQLVVCGGTGSGSGAPTDPGYWVSNSTNVTGLSAEKLLGALSTGLVLNTAGTPSAYTGTSCAGSSQAIRVINGSGQVTACTNVGMSLMEDGVLKQGSILTFNLGPGLDWVFDAAGQAQVYVDATEIGGGGSTPTTSGYHPFGTPGSSTIAAPIADDCIGWQAASPFSGNNAFVSALEVTTADANDIVKVGIYTASGGARVFNGSVTVNAVARTTFTNNDAFQAWVATDHWFVVCCDSPDGLCTTRFRAAGGAQQYGKQITFDNPQNNATLPTAINTFIPVDPWTTNAEPPALFVRLE